uniref:Uncharacterized protein n=1 Tax=Strigamia maritima TaxID=126957 RepID=T1IYF0_STRMM
RFTYDIIALLSDLGGNLGLFLGLSVLSVPQITWYLYHVLSSSRKKRPVNKILRLCKINKKLIEDVEQTKETKVLVKVHLMLVVISAGCTLYLFQSRLNYYIEEPVRKIVTIDQRQYTKYPTVTVCGEMQNYEMEEAKLRLLNEANKTCNNILTWQLVNNKLSLEDVWNSLNLDEIIIVTDLNQKIEKSLIPLPFGHCSQLNAEKTTELTNQFEILLPALFPSEVCDSYLTIFLNNHEEEVNILSPLTLHYGRFSILSLQIFKNIQRATNQKPCEENEAVYIKCQYNCKQNNLLRMINCRLPYVLKPTLPPCNTTEEITNAHFTYLKNYELNQKLCKCKQPCTKIYYQTISQQHD